MLFKIDSTVSTKDIEKAQRELKETLMMENEEKISESQFKKRQREKIFPSKIYEQFDEETYKLKMGIDALFYEALVKEDLDSKYQTIIESMIKPLFESIYKVYKHIDIKPEYYGKLDDKIIVAPLEEREKVINETITDHFKRNYYNLPISRRLELYENEAIPVVTELVENKCSIEKASEVGTKTVVLERFLTKVAFPKFLWETIKTLQEDEDYEIFDQDKLVELVNDFKSNVRGISKIISCTL